MIAATHRISGVSQQQSQSQDLTFSSQKGNHPRGRSARCELDDAG